MPDQRPPLQQISDFTSSLTSCSPFVRIQDQVQCTLSYQKMKQTPPRCQLVELSSCDPRQLERLRFVILYKKATRHIVEPLLALLAAGFDRWSKNADDRPIDRSTNQKQNATISDMTTLSYCGIQNFHREPPFLSVLIYAFDDTAAGAFSFRAASCSSSVSTSPGGI